MDNGFNGIFLVATNPLDVMTYLTWKYSNLPANRVIGSGTSLDTSRLRYLIGNKLKVNPKNIHAYVIGEHGDSEFVPWSNVNVGLQNISKFLNNDDCNLICNDVKNAAYEIINRKGATYYGIGMCLVRITNAILGDENTIITVSTYDEDNDIFIGLPTILNKNGASEKVYVELNEEENRKLQNCIDIIKEAIKHIGI
jgi:L-lactate dehydrogenase